MRTNDSTANFEILKHYAQAAADEIRGFIQECTLEGYKNFLNTMYHYTFTSEEQLQTAAERSPTPELKDYFLHQAKEERGHYLLALRDLEAFDCEPEKETTPAILEYRKYWEAISQEKAAQYLGAVYVFENVASFLGRDVLGMMERLRLTKKQSRWLIVHMEADQGHGAEAEEIAQKYFTEFHDDILKGAKTFYQLWVNIFKDAFVEKDSTKQAA